MPSKLTGDDGTLPPPPPGWGGDRLTEFHCAALLNSYATYVQMRPAANQLIDVDGAFHKAAENLRNPPDVLGAMLLLRSHSAYRAATRLAMSGEAPETFPLLRACLEYALYAVHINRNPGYGEIWMRRHQDEAARKNVRKAFQHADVMNTLKVADAILASQVAALYERCVDFGAHPNERGMTGSMTMEKVSEGKLYAAVYAHDDSLTLSHLMKTTAQIGLGALLILSLIFNERFKDLGIDLSLQAFKRVL
jgi:hypothetical protein